MYITINILNSKFFEIILRLGLSFNVSYITDHIAIS